MVILLAAGKLKVLDIWFVFSAAAYLTPQSFSYGCILEIMLMTRNP